MTPVKQSLRHDPENGIWGDCHRAAMASLFDLPLKSVPHFWENGGNAEEGNLRVDEWLSARGFSSVGIPFTATFEEVMAMMDKQATNIHYLFVGTSKTGVNHTVIAKGGAIVFDPSLNESGIIGPCDDGFYWCEFIVPKNPGALT